MRTKFPFFALIWTVLAACAMPALAATRSATAIMQVSVTVPSTCSASVNPATGKSQAQPVAVVCNAATPYRVNVSKRQAEESAAAHAAPAAPTVQYGSLAEAAQSANAGILLVSVTY